MDTETTWKPRYIHEVFNQEELLKNAIYQEQHNKLSLKHLLSIEQNKKKTRAILKRRKFRKPISYKSYLDEKGKICYSIRNKFEKVTPVDLLDEFYSVENSEIETDEQELATETLLGKRKVSKAQKGQTDEEGKQLSKGKYLDPVTGAYYNTVKEFKMLRALNAIDNLEKLGAQRSLMKNLFIGKKKKLSYFHYDLKG